MAIIIRNEFGHFIKHDRDGCVIKVKEESEAENFQTLENAIVICKLYPKKTRGYYVYDTETKRICYRTRPNKEKPKRKHWHEKTRRMIYEKADGRCVLCGRKIKFEEMSLDHIIPLSQGGLDNVENLQSTCLPCNEFKQNILPDEFHNRITEIFLYQMEKRCRNGLKWKFVHRLLVGMI